MPKRSKDDVKWGYFAVMKFIGLLRRYSLLWNRSLPNYKRPKYRAAAINKIAIAMGTTPLKIRNKIHVMRSQCRKENMQLKKNPNYQPRWRYFEEVRNMLSYDESMCITPRMKRENRTSEGSDFTEDDDTNDKTIPVEYDSTLEEEFEKEMQSSLDIKQQYDEFKIIGENIADKLRLLNDYKSIQLAFKCKIMQALLEANEALYEKT